MTDSHSSDISSTPKPKYSNRLANEKSPYLLQHSEQPVNWFPWGEEAFKLAKEQDKLIFISIGYSTCHWCHVMAHESFDNPEIAKVMNDLFINIKVDREERPDIDKIYMTYITEISGSGGWPASIWTTPNLEPITAGTYFAPTAKYGRPGFPTMCERINQAWKKDREMVQSRANTFLEFLKEDKPKGNKDNAISIDTIERCHSFITSNYDKEYGGFSSAPKFPRTSIFNFLHATHKRFPDTLEKIHFTLEMMARGGIYDQLGGGFHRYSVTEDWRVPHFEKMLYDQGQIANVYLDAYQISKNPEFEKTVRGILSYVQRDLTHPLGGFYSAEDADSLNPLTNEKQEGAFYVWPMGELSLLLTPEEFDVFTFIYGCGTHGNVAPEDDPHHEFTDKNIIMRVHSDKETQNFLKLDSLEQVEKLLQSAHKKLFEYRSKNRPRPHLDDKIITSWNALMISSFARAYQILSDKSFLESAERSLQFIKSNLYDESSKTLIRNYKDGPSNIKAFGDDYANLIQALLDLYEATFKIEYLKWAIDLQESFHLKFHDSKNGGYFSTSGQDSSLLSRMKEEHDGAEPSCQSITVCNLVRLYNITKLEKYHDLVKSTLESCSLYLEKAPSVTPQMVVGLLYYLENFNTVIIIGDNSDPNREKILKNLNSLYVPNKVILVKDINDHDSEDFFKNHTENLTYQSASNLYNQTTVFICNSSGCLSPQYDLKQIESLFNNLK